MSPPLSRGSAPLDVATIAALKAEIAKPGMNADKLRQRLVPAPSGATFWRALHGQKVSKPVQAACADMARELRGYASPVRVAEHGIVQPVDSKVFSLRDAVDCIDSERAHTYDFDPDPEAA